MRQIKVFDSVSLDGYFTDAHGDMSWAHKRDPEWAAFTAGNASGRATLVFGRKTYDLMKSYWPTKEAMKAAPVVAEAMNGAQKIVFSNSLDPATLWNNTRLIKGDIVAETRKLKEEKGPDLVIMGSGTIVAQLTQARLIDEYQIILNNLVLGSGRTLFDGVKDRLTLVLKSSRSFENGNVVLTYEPAR
jgi:dihydrofolate reductase